MGGGGGGVGLCGPNMIMANQLLLWLDMVRYTWVSYYYYYYYYIYMASYRQID